MPTGARGSWTWEVGRRVARARHDDLKITQAQLGERLGLSRKTISEVENGRRAIPKSEVAGFAQVLGIPEHLLDPSQEIGFDDRQPMEKEERSPATGGRITSSDALAELARIKVELAREMAARIEREEAGAALLDGIIESITRIEAEIAGGDPDLDIIDAAVAPDEEPPPTQPGAEPRGKD